MNKKLTAALIAAGALPFAAQALELSVEYEPDFAFGNLINDTTLSATLDTVTGELALGSSRSTALNGPLTTEVSRVADNSLVVNLLTGERAFVRSSGFTGEDVKGITDVNSAFLITRAIAPNGDGTFDYASAFEASFDGDQVDFTASSDLAAFAGVSTVADIRAQIQAGLSGN